MLMPFREARNEIEEKQVDCRLGQPWLRRGKFKSAAMGLSK
jgi:hypothetical protein